MRLFKIGFFWGVAALAAKAGAVKEITVDPVAPALVKRRGYF